jgi:hypothetical protein
MAGGQRKASKAGRQKPRQAGRQAEEGDADTMSKST